MEPILSCIIALSLALLLFVTLSKNPNNLPPGPPSLPIIGHLHLLSKPLHLSLARLAHRHGPILHLRLGSRPVLVVSTLALAKECFTANDIAFANRPHLPSIKHHTSNYTSLAAAPYGPHWRNLRRMAAAASLSPTRINALAGIRAAEVESLVGRLFRDSQGEGFKKVDLRRRIFDLVFDVMMGMIAGEKYRGDAEWGRGFKGVVEEVFAMIGGDIRDFVPILRWVGFEGANKRRVGVQERKEIFLQALIEKHRRDDRDFIDEEKEKTVIDVLLDLQREDSEANNEQNIRTLISRKVNGEGAVSFVAGNRIFEIVDAAPFLAVTAPTTRRRPHRSTPSTPQAPLAYLGGHLPLDAVLLNLDAVNTSGASRLSRRPSPRRIYTWSVCDM